MTGEQLRRARQRKNWEQDQAAARLGVSQPYLSLLEAGKRPLTKSLTRRAVRVYNLSAIHLPTEKLFDEPENIGENELAKNLAALGYPKLAHLKAGRKKNPAQVLLSALEKRDLDSRLVEALPWLAAKFADLDWETIFKIAKANDLQNKLGFIITLASRLAERSGNRDKTELLRRQELRLKSSRLYGEGTLCRDSMTAVEKKWLRKVRLAEARFWRLLTDLSIEHIDYVE